MPEMRFIDLFINSAFFKRITSMTSLAPLPPPPPPPPAPFLGGSPGALPPAVPNYINGKNKYSMKTLYWNRIKIVQGSTAIWSELNKLNKINLDNDFVSQFAKNMIVPKKESAQKVKESAKSKLKLIIDA